MSKKIAVLQAAKELFGQCGYAETTFKKIAERAGVAVGLLAHHFGTKEKLFLAAGLDVLEDFVLTLRSATANSPNGRAAVLDFCRAYLDFSIDPQSSWLVLVRCSPYSDMKTGAERDIMNLKFLEVHDLLTTQLERGLADGSVPATLSARGTAHVLIALMVGVNRTRVLTPYAHPDLYDEALGLVNRSLD